MRRGAFAAPAVDRERERAGARGAHAGDGVGGARGYVDGRHGLEPLSSVTGTVAGIAPPNGVGGRRPSRRRSRPGRAAPSPAARAAEAVDGVVGDPHRLVLVAEADHRHDRAEDLLLRDALLVVDLVEDRRLVVVALREICRTLAAGDALRALVLADRDVLLDGV